jgi:hypothetical protein
MRAASIEIYFVSMEAEAIRFRRSKEDVRRLAARLLASFNIWYRRKA